MINYHGKGKKQHDFTQKHSNKRLPYNIGEILYPKAQEQVAEEQVITQ